MDPDQRCLTDTHILKTQHASFQTYRSGLYLGIVISIIEVHIDKGTTALSDSKQPHMSEGLGLG